MRILLVKLQPNLRKLVLNRIESKIELEKIKNQDSLSREKLESIADTLRIDYDGKDDESLKNDINAAIKRGNDYDLP